MLPVQVMLSVTVYGAPCLGIVEKVALLGNICPELKSMRSVNVPPFVLILSPASDSSDKLPYILPQFPLLVMLKFQVMVCAVASTLIEVRITPILPWQSGRQTN